MILVALVIGVVLIVAAIRNSQGALFSALGQDIPGFVVWAAAIVAVGALGFIPGLKPVSRGLLALVLIVIVLNNYQAILQGFTTAANPKNDTSSSGSQSSGSTANDNSTVGTLMQVSDVANSFAGGATV